LTANTVTRDGSPFAPLKSSGAVHTYPIFLQPTKHPIQPYANCLL